VESTVILTLCFSVVLILLLSAAILGIMWAIRQQKILVLTKFQMELIREQSVNQMEKIREQMIGRMDRAIAEFRQAENSSSETLKLLDKSIGLLSSKEPLAYQAIQTMNAVGEPQIVSSEENERRMLSDDSDGLSSLDDPRLAAELSGLI